jgi:hypothetical protein
MSAATPSATDALAFRWPKKVPGCACAICTRFGAVAGAAFLDADYPSPFTQYRLVKIDGWSERDPTDEERAQFNAQYPALAFSRTAGEAGGKLATPWIKACLKLLRQLQKLKPASAFLKPVDIVALNIPDYPAIIKHPMDLATIEAKLLATEARQAAAEIGPPRTEADNDGTTYASPDDFASDVRMIWRNCFLYDKEAHAVTAWAKELSIKFEQGFLLL